MLVADDADPDALLVRVPFVTLDLEALATDSLGCSPSVTSLPGLIPDLDEPFLARQTFPGQVRSGAAPREIALRVLSSDHYRVCRLRVAFQPGKRPSRLEVFVASTPSRAARASSMDPLSQYLSADFTLLSEPITWPPESALRWPLASTEVTIPVEQAHQSDYAPAPAFLKLVVYRPHAHPNNYDREIGCLDIELLGTFQLPSRQIKIRDMTESTHQADPTFAEETARDSVRRSLEAAGLPESLIQELIEAASETAPVTTIRGSEDKTVEKRDQATSLLGVGFPEPSRAHNVLDSPFDLAMREFVDLEARLNQLLGATAPSHEDASRATVALTRSLSMPRIDSPIRRDLEAIAAFTFGSFFTQCLLSRGNAPDGTGDGSEGVCVESLRVAEHLAPLLLVAGLPAELAFEGLVAAVTLALRSPPSCPLSVFHASLQLTRTIFQARSRGLGLVGELRKAQLGPALQSVLDAILATPHCWSLSSKTTVDRELLQSMRLLVTQLETRPSFLRAVMTADPHGNQENRKTTSFPGGLSVSLNRLRVVRWILQRHGDKLSASDRLMTRSFIEPFATVGDQKLDFKGGKELELAHECIRLLGKSPESSVADLDTQLRSLRKHLQHDTQLPATISRDHISLFEAYPLSSEQQQAIVTRLKQYFQLHTRPTALYHHEFSTSHLGDDRDEQEFRKGNIVFRGRIEERHVPANSFHNTMDAQTKPFEFSATSTTGSQPPVVAMETSFARFRGTLEPRGSNESPRRPAPAAVQPRVVAPEPASPRIGVTRPKSSSRTARVVPVNESSTTPPTIVGDALEPTTTMTRQDASNDLPTAAPAPAALVATERRAVTAAPSVGVERGAPSANAGVQPPPGSGGSKPSVTTPVAPKTAPAGNPRKSQDAGCAVQ